MYNQYPYNGRWYEGNNFGVSLSTPPVYSPSVITAVANVQQGMAVPKFVMGGMTSAVGEAFALMKKSTSYVFSMWQSKRYSIGSPFNVVEINLPLSHAPETDTLIIPILNFDDGETVVAGTPIRLLDYPEGGSHITLGAANFDYDVHGERNFMLEFHFRGTLTDVMLPINIQIETEEQG